MKNWKKPLAAVLAGMLCVISMPQVQPVLPAFSAAAAFLSEAFLQLQREYFLRQASV